MRIDNTEDLIIRLKSKEFSNIFITTHHKPDGDAMGSTLGLWHILQKMGLKATVITPTDYSENLSWLPGNNEVIDFTINPEKVKQLLKESDLIFCLDFNKLSRINELGELVSQSNTPSVLIDHHQDPDKFYKYAYWNNESSSTCELVYEFGLKAFGKNVFTADAVNCLYTGLMTDTGNFQYVNTKPQTLRIGADLIELGAKHTLIHERIYNVFSINRSRLFGYCLYEKLEVLEDCRTALIYLNREELQRFQVVTGDTEGLVNFGLGLKDIVLSVLIIDRIEKVKMSFRSKGSFAVNKYAEKYFSGGGHINAAGGASGDSLENVVSKFKSTIKEYKSELQKV
ncbi:MAG: DHH family phosphoesterase [Bacteroidia bacterium]